MNKYVLSMAALRLISGSIEITAALIMLRLNHIERSLLVNTSLAVIGPFILLFTTSIGLIGMADKVSFYKMAWILIGVACIFIGILKVK